MPKSPLTPVGTAMLLMWVMTNVGFWVGYLAGKRRWKDNPDLLVKP